MMTTSKDLLCDKSDAEILNKPERLGFVVTWILREALKKIDSAFALWGGCHHVAAVDLLDENEGFLKI